MGEMQHTDVRVAGETMGLPVPPTGWMLPIGRFDPKAARAHASANGRPSAAEIDAAVGRFQAAGLVARATTTPSVVVRGGARFVADGEVGVFEEPFLISLQPDGSFLVLVGSRGNQTDEASTRTLTEAVELVTYLYRVRPRDGSSL